MIAIVLIALVLFFRGRPERQTPKRPAEARTPPERKNPAPASIAVPKTAPFDATTAEPTPEKITLRGPAYIVDGDTLVIRKNQIRLFGVDAPEMNHPYGKTSKWALVKLCKGQTIEAEVTDQDTHGRVVAKCRLPDGRDLSAEMVKLGLAIDWPKFSGGVYRSLERPEARKKLWLADARQKGRMHVWEKFEARQNARKTSQAE
ncbi:thermonuclease family protein [Primorskyibacter sp. 2E107]|uniref:thermonuclease family protein n=1 Tax=Primorskyibacter sp. 2E107 TaxID=3403458 RepID=UPI003AF9682F